MTDTASIPNIIDCVQALIASSRISEAADLLENAVSQSPSCSETPAMARLFTYYYFCRYQETGKTDDLERMAACARTCEDREKAEDFCRFARQLLQLPYVEYLPDIRDELTDCLHCLPGETGDVTQLKLNSAVWPAASSRNALFLALSNYRQQSAGLSLSVTHPSCNFCEAPLAPEGIRLWHYEKDHTAVPAVSEPEEPVYKRVELLAREPFHLGEWYRKAGKLVRGLTVQDSNSLYGCMIYPREPDAEITSDQWLFRIQCASVCLLAHLRDESLPESLTCFPSPELVRICLGQPDWPVIPAITLLAWQVREDIAPPSLVNPILDRLIACIPPSGPCFYEHALISAVSWIPGRNQKQKARAQRWRFELESFRNSFI